MIFWEWVTSVEQWHRAVDITISYGKEGGEKWRLCITVILALIFTESKTVEQEIAALILPQTH